MDDCSCMPTCKRRGNCCSDYNCDNIYKLNNMCSNQCLYCKDKCLMCIDSFYLYEGKCYTRCPQNTKEDQNNFICYISNRIDN